MKEKTKMNMNEYERKTDQMKDEQYCDVMMIWI